MARAEHPPACKCAPAPHSAEWLLLDLDATYSRVLARACDTSLPALLAHVLAMAMLLVLGCGERSTLGELDAGDAGERDGNGHVVDLVDGSELELDAGELQDGDAGELADARADGEDLEGSDDAGDAGELEHDASDDAGAQLEQCTDDKHTFLCRAARCATVCKVGSNLMCCEGDDAAAVLCACEVAP